VGADNFGWKFSSVVMFALTIPAVYLIGALIGGRVAGAVAAATLAFSHYLIEFTHIGYDHIDSLLPAAWAFALFFLAMRTRSPMLFFVAGVAAGLCMYTNIAARIVYPVIIAWAVWRMFISSPKDMRNWLLPWIIGAIVTVLPIFAVDGIGLVEQMLGRVIGGQGELSELGTLDRIVRNLELNLYAFNYNAHISHYVSGSLLDPFSAVLAVAAVAFALGRAGDPASDFLIIWLTLGFGATGAISPYDWHVAVTRLFPLMIPIALAMGLFVAKFVWPIEINIYSSHGAAIFNSKTFTVIGLLIAGGLVWGLNYQRAEYDTPKVFHNSSAAMTISALRSEHCQPVSGDRVAIVSRDEHIIREILNSYEPGSIELSPNAPQMPGAPIFLNHQRAIEGGLGDVEQYSCIIFSHPWEAEPAMVLDDLQASNPFGTVIPYSGQSVKVIISIFKPF
jgi:4-amino-4-deoxy-L-arabinose transferase-like glycosyltransferase